ncbi:MAG TPA: type II toxin-antitoxin system RelE/ParE family toxin [Candidatus Angelobacter sp.]
MQVKWLRVALDNLDAEAEYIARDNPSATAKVVAAIEKAVQLLSDYPALGRPGRVHGTRELVVPGTPYIVPYRVRGNKIEILRVFHGARKWPKCF